MLNLLLKSIFRFGQFALYHLVGAPVSEIPDLDNPNILGEGFDRLVRDILILLDELRREGQKGSKYVAGDQITARPSASIPVPMVYVIKLFSCQTM